MTMPAVTPADEVDLFAATPADDPDRFLLHPVVQSYVAVRAFGEPTPPVAAVIGELRTRTRPGDRLLCVGHRNAGHALRIALALPDRHVEATLIDGDRVAWLEAAAESHGLERLSACRTDVDQLRLDRASFDAVAALEVLHWANTLEQFWRECRRTLRGARVVLMQGLAGPDRLAWTASQCELASRALFEVVPEALRAHHATVTPQTFASLLAEHPRYCARSSEIEATCVDAGFTLPGRAVGGCALLHPVLLGQICGYSPTDWNHNRVLAELFAREADAIAAGELVDDYLMFVAQAPS